MKQIEPKYVEGQKTDKISKLSLVLYVEIGIHDQ